jgi:hypothetical protein
VPAESLDKLNVTVAVAEPSASLPVTGGTSFEVRRAAVKVADEFDEDGIVAVSLHPTSTLPAMTNAEKYVKRFMSIAPMNEQKKGLVEMRF